MRRRHNKEELQEKPQSTEVKHNPFFNDRNTDNDLRSPLLETFPMGNTHYPDNDDDEINDDERYNGDTVLSRQRSTVTGKIQLNALYVWCTLLDAFPDKVSSRFLPNEPKNIQEYLGSISNSYVKPYDSANSEHVAMLHRLWKAYWQMRRMDEPTLPESKDAEEWKIMGFQGKNPATDFRGAGLFSLWQLTYLAERHPEVWESLADDQYPFAAAAINVSMKLIALLQLSNQLSMHLVQRHNNYTTSRAKVNLCRSICVGSNKQAEHRLNEVFCACVALMDRIWLQSDRNLLEFNALLKIFYNHLEQALLASPDLLSLFHALNSVARLK